MVKILVVCTGNSCRSQMAEAIIRRYTTNHVEVFSAGVSPEKVNPKTIQVMDMIGIDISCYKSNSIDEYVDIDFDFLITVCDNAHERCPYFANTIKKIHRSFIDPAKARGTDKEIMNVYCDVRDSIQKFILDFLHKESDVFSGYLIKSTE